MEKAIIARQGKGWLITLDNGKKLTCNWNNLPDELDGKQITIVRKDGAPYKITVEEREFMQPAKPAVSNFTKDDRYFKKGGASNTANKPYRKKTGNYERNVEGRENDPARAPYNFVPLNKSVVSPHIVTEYNKSNELLSGTIDLNLKALIPIFIRGEKESFFRSNEKYLIPGSSLRGLIRNMLEMLSFGGFTTFTDKRLYNRSFAEPESDVKWYYYSRMGMPKDDRDLAQETSLPGYLNYDEIKERYYILPIEGKVERTEMSDKSFKHIFVESASKWKVYSGTIGRKRKKHWILPLPVEDNAENKLYIHEKDIRDYINDTSRKLGGDAENILLKAKRKISKYPTGIPIFYGLYKDDENCERISFGHTKFFRIPYHKSIGNHVPKALLENDSDFANELFGGDNGLKSGKLNFEDAICINNTTELAIPNILSSPKPTTFQHYLIQPNGYKTKRKDLNHWGSAETAIRGYKQYWHKKAEDTKSDKWKHPNPSISRYTFERFLRHYKLGGIEEFVQNYDKFLELDINPNQGNIRSVIIKKPLSELPDDLVKILYKLVFPDKEASKKHGKVLFSIVRVLSEGSKFKSRIRFENLTSEELGALLSAIDLPSGCYHKLGMGKPLGLGSVHIGIEKLTFIDREDRYSKLFNDDNHWQTGEVDKTEEIDGYKKTFEDFMLNQLVLVGEISESAKNLWAIDRLSELKTMLTFEHDLPDAIVAWPNRTRYQTLKEFQDRSVLPKPSEVIQKDTYKKQ